MPSPAPTARRAFLGPLAAAWARPRGLALGAYLAFAAAFVALFAAAWPFALGAVAVNAPLTLAAGWLLAVIERFARRDAVEVRERALRYASLMWSYGALVFAAAFASGLRA